jgi:hypothetical protein
LIALLMFVPDKRTLQVMIPYSEAVAQAASALKTSSHRALRQLRVEGSENTLIIQGTVSCYYLKQLAQETLRSIRGNLHLENRVQVEAAN